MCLAVPMKLVRRDGLTGEVELDGVRREVSLLMLADAREGEFVLVHAGFAIGTVDEAEAEATIALLRKIGDEGGTRW